MNVCHFGWKSGLEKRNSGRWRNRFWPLITLFLMSHVGVFVSFLNSAETNASPISSQFYAFEKVATCNALSFLIVAHTSESSDFCV